MSAKFGAGYARRPSGTLRLLALLILLTLRVGQAQGNPVLVRFGLVDVRTYGAIPNDGQDDTLAVRNAAEAINQVGGGVLFFPPGTWDIANLGLAEGGENLGAPPLTQAPRHLTLMGNREGGSILRRIPSEQPGDQRRLMTVGGATDFALMHLTLDMHGMQNYGGVGVFGCTRCTVAHNHFLDIYAPPIPSNPNDRYAVAFGYSAQMHTDISIYANRVEHGLQIEVDHVDGAVIRENTVVAPRFTAGIGVFGLKDDHTTKNIKILHNRIIDPDNGGGALDVHFDFGGGPAANRRVEHVDIIGNRIEYTESYGKAPTTAIRIGVGNNSLRTTGTVMSNVRILDNTIVAHPSLPSAKDPLIFGNTSDISMTKFEQILVAHNTLESDVAHTFVKIAQTSDSTVTQYNNRRLGAETQPEGRVVLAVNVGGVAFAGTDGVSYEADRGFVGGQKQGHGESLGIGLTDDDRLYATQREGTFAYRFPVPNGTYQVTLKFAEKEALEASQRVFDVMIEGLVVITQLDLFAVARRRNAYDATLPVTVSDGRLDLQMILTKWKPVLSAIVVRQ